MASILSYLAIRIDDPDRTEMVEVRSPDVLHAERAFKNFSMQDLNPGDMTMTTLYRMAYITLRRSGVLADGTTLGQFEDEWEISMSAEQIKRARRAAGMPDVEVDEEDGDASGNPTSEVL